jgi:pSer/pThr/pTyr-binding forkhead associated (FHA) protein
MLGRLVDARINLSMSSLVGIVCGSCDWFNPRDGLSCERCGNDLTLPGSAAEAANAGQGVPAWVAPSTFDEDDPSETIEPELADELLIEVDLEAAPTPVPGLDGALVAEAARRGVLVLQPFEIGVSAVEWRRSKERQMEQARHYVCKSCYSPVPGGHKFCGKCGTPTNFGEDYGATQYFGAMQVPNKAKLILIKGEGLDGISYHLNSTEHVAGRQQGAILFPDDAWLSPRHANFFYRDQKLFVRDEDSLNGVYVRVRESAEIVQGGMFLCGEQVFRVEASDVLSEGPEPDGTYFYASPTKTWSFRVVQILPGGITGMTVHDEGGKVTIGREDCMMSYLDDPYMSLHHAQVTAADGQFLVTDLGSQNGTYVRIDQEQALMHGDYVFLGKQLLRVEVTP